MRYLEEVQSGVHVNLSAASAPNNSSGTASNASTTSPPTTARYAAADLSMTSGIRRNLFGCVNNEENAQFLKNQLDSIKEEARLRWNFDFESETPEDGRYEWTRVLVEPRSLLNPEQPREERAASGASAAAATKVNRERASPSTFCHPHPQPLNNQQIKITICKPLLQTKITDHLVEKKRSHVFLDEPCDSSNEPETRLNHVTSSKRPKLKSTTNNNLESNRSESNRWKQQSNST